MQSSRYYKDFVSYAFPICLNIFEYFAFTWDKRGIEMVGYSGLLLICTFVLYPKYSKKNDHYSGITL